MIHYVQGDATQPRGSSNRIIAHVCNDSGGWGKGFVLAVSRRWAAPEAAYREWYRHRATNDFALGAVQFVQVEPYLKIANMVAQRGVKTGSSGPPVRYEAVRYCLKVVAEEAVRFGACVHIPRITCGLGGGSWGRVEPIIESELISRGIDVTVYDWD